ncbi:MAG: hypothetical protein ABR551_06740 [Gemmatimonadales bacterium]
MVRESFGVDVPVYRNDNLHIVNRAIASDGSGRVWAIPRLRYEPTLWSTSGKMVELHRRAAWFPAQVAVQSPGRERAPTPWVTNAWHDGVEHLWILLHVPDANWRPPRPGSIPSGERIAPIDLDREYDTILEVINTTTGQLLVTQRYDALVKNLLPGGYAVHYREDARGEPFLDIWQFRLVTPTRR